MPNRAKTFERGRRAETPAIFVMKKQSLCQTCFNYTDCPWHLRFEPRPDWVAVATLIKLTTKPEIYINSYRVIKCPAFRTREQWERVTLFEMGALFGVHWRTVARHAQHHDLHEYALKHGYEVTIKKGEKYREYYMRQAKYDKTDIKNI